MKERITRKVIDAAVEKVRLVMKCYGLLAHASSVVGERMGGSKNVVKFNGLLRVTATFPNGYQMLFWAHDTAGLLRDAVSQCADAEYDRWLNGSQEEAKMLAHILLEPKCYECGETDDPIRTCEQCGNKYCWEHGQRGGDRQVQDVGAVAYPGLCDKCRG